MSSNGECFIVFPAVCASGYLIVGRNAEDVKSVEVAQEIHFIDGSELLEGKTDGGVAASEAVADASNAKLRIILQKPKPGVWGGDFGANENNVAIAITWATDETVADGDTLLGTDIVRLTLAQVVNAEAAVDQIGAFVARYINDTAKLNFVICDPENAWLLSCAGKVWAAEKVQNKNYLRVPTGGLTVTNTIDKSSEGLDASDNFAAAHDAEIAVPVADWCGPPPDTYTQYDMFETLRTACTSSSRAANVSVLTGARISCHWFTGTPNASESVFKPFVFAPRPRISPLTKVQPKTDVTLLHKLHGQRKPGSLEHLRSLESSCVQELNNYFGLQDYPSEELDELLKDCVEAEVKFYR